MGKNLSNYYEQKLLDSENNLQQTHLQLPQRKPKKITETTGNLTGNKIAYKITNKYRKLSNDYMNKKIDAEFSEKHAFHQIERQQIISILD